MHDMYGKIKWLVGAVVFFYGLYWFADANGLFTPLLNITETQLAPSVAAAVVCKEERRGAALTVEWEQGGYGPQARGRVLCGGRSMVTHFHYSLNREAVEIANAGSLDNYLDKRADAVCSGVDKSYSWSRDVPDPRAAQNTDGSNDEQLTCYLGFTRAKRELLSEEGVQEWPPLPNGNTQRTPAETR